MRAAQLQEKLKEALDTMLDASRRRRLPAGSKQRHLSGLQADSLQSQQLAGTCLSLACMHLAEASMQAAGWLSALQAPCRGHLAEVTCLRLACRNLAESTLQAPCRGHWADSCPSLAESILQAPYRGHLAEVTWQRLPAPDCIWQAPC